MIPNHTAARSATVCYRCKTAAPTEGFDEVRLVLSSDSRIIGIVGILRPGDKDACAEFAIFGAAALFAVWLALRYRGRIALAADAPLYVSAHKGRLQQMLGNILDNALKFTSMMESSQYVRRARDAALGDG